MIAVRALVLLLVMTPLAIAQEASPFPAAWQDLLSADESKAARAACLFSSKPKECLEFFKEELTPVKVEPKRFAKLIAELASKDFRTREAAQLDLEYFGKFAKEQLIAAQKANTNAEVRVRLERLLGRISAYELSESAKDAVPESPNINGRSVSVSSGNGKINIVIDGKPLVLTPKIIEKLPPPATWVRAGRAIGVLEFLGTPESVKLLEMLSEGEEAALPTKLAKEALQRLKTRK